MRPVHLASLLGLFNQLQRQGVSYRLGAKADNRQFNPQSDGQLSTAVNTITSLDCSGFTRYILYASSGDLVPNGSQNQLSYFQQNIGADVSLLSTYVDVNRTVSGPTLSIAFIKPFVNGCGNIGNIST
jgi:hypothetical protein